MTAPVVAAPNGTDDTEALDAAVTQALGTADGAQAVVRVVPNPRRWHYRFAGYELPADVLIELDPAVVLQPPRTVTPDTPPRDKRVVMFALTKANCGIVSAGAPHMSALKGHFRAVDPDLFGDVPIEELATVILDPSRAMCSNLAVFADVTTAEDWLLDGLFTVQNATNQPRGDKVPWPTTATAAVHIRADAKSPLGDPANYLQPRNGVYRRHANLGGPRGYGPNQFNAATGLVVSGMWSAGGTSVRLETDGSMKNHRGELDRGAILDGLVATDVRCVNGNRALSLSPHAQVNGVVTISGVRARSCFDGVVCSADLGLPLAARGSFDATVTDVTVDAGGTAQCQSDAHLWDVGQSRAAVYVGPKVTWTHRIDTPTTTGTFTAR